MSMCRYLLWANEPTEQRAKCLDSRCPAATAAAGNDGGSDRTDRDDAVLGRQWDRRDDAVEW